jgi:hypothetical protein
MATVSKLDIESADSSRTPGGIRSVTVYLEGISQLVGTGKTKLARNLIDKFLPTNPD